MKQAKQRETAPQNMSSGSIQPTQIFGNDRHESAALHAQLVELKQDFAEQERGIEALRLANAHLERALAREKLQNRELLRSNSWRLTSPLRGVVGAGRSFCNAIRRAAGLDPAAAFFREGFLAPVDLLTPAQCRRILDHYRRAPSLQEERKALAAKDRVFYDIATQPALLGLLRRLLGEDIVLWGSKVIGQKPGQEHIWHTDIESSAIDGGFVSVWIGLENASEASGLRLISRSHKFSKPIQQAAHERGLRREQITDEYVAAWASEHDRHARLIRPQVHDGQAIVFDGRLWHGSYNGAPKPRLALLLQYAAADQPIAFPEDGYFDWPFRFSSESPRRIVVSGIRETGNTVPPPQHRPAATSIRTNLHLGDGFLESPAGWQPYPLFRGKTPVIGAMSAHVSVLSPGHSPHPPHCHPEEELLVVLKGEAEIVVPKTADPAGARIERLAPGSFVYYPANQYHTIRNASQLPVTYLMFKWRGAPAKAERPLATATFDIGGIDAPQSSTPRTGRILFESQTAYLGKLHAHVTDLQPGVGYAPHKDRHDVAILVFSGQVETLGQRVGPGGSIYYAAGEPHGLRNIGDTPARYLVFEFHGPRPV